MTKEKEEWTGERLETFVLSENASEHLHRYAMALEWAAGKKVLDIACGEGYGSNLLARKAEEVVGVDIAAEVILDASKKYVKDNLRFLQGRADAIPLENEYFDLVVSFETIEHHDRHQEMMLEIKRVLKSDGILIISSPDKRYYSDTTGYKNPFHIKELYRDEFEDLIRSHFRESHFFFQKFVKGSLVFPTQNNESTAFVKMYSGNYESIAEVEVEAVYAISVASDNKLPIVEASFFDGQEIVRSQQKAELDYAIFKVSAKVAADVSGQLKSSLEYRLGLALLRPLRAIKRLLNG